MQSSRIFCLAEAGLCNDDKIGCAYLHSRASIIKFSLAACHTARSQNTANTSDLLVDIPSRKLHQTMVRHLTTKEASFNINVSGV